MEQAIDGERVTVAGIMDELGSQSFPALILIPALLAISPLSTIPGVTSMVGITVALLAVQMILGRKCAWLPGFVGRRSLPSDGLRKAIGWVRTPASYIERLFRPRLQFLVRRPGSFLPLIICLSLACFMPVLELVPMSGTVASTAISIIAAGLLTRDGLAILVALGFVGFLGFLLRGVLF